MTDRLTIYYLDGRKEEFDVDRPVVTLGRGSSCDIVLPYEGISRKHVMIEFQEDVIFITDLGSTNGVLIDGKKITPNTRTPFQTYLNLQFGPVQSINFSSKTKEMTSSLITTSMGETRKKTNEDVTSASETIPLKKQRTSKGTHVRRVEKKEGVSPLLIVGVLIIAGGIYFQFFLNKEEVEVTPVATAPVETTKPLPISTEFNKVDEIQSARQSASCSDEGLCRTFRLKRELGEGIWGQDKTYFVFINLGEHAKRKSSGAFSNLSDPEKFEVYLLEHLSEGFGVKFIYRHKTHTNVQLIGFAPEGQTLKVNMKINRDVNPIILDSGVIGSLVQEVRELGSMENIKALRSQYQIQSI